MGTEKMKGNSSYTRNLTITQFCFWFTLDTELHGFTAQAENGQTAQELPDGVPSLQKTSFATKNPVILIMPRL